MTDLPVFAMRNRNTEDIDVTFEMTYAGDLDEFRDATYRCTLRNAMDPTDVIDFSSSTSAPNRIFVDISADGSGRVSFSFKAPWRAQQERTGAYAAELLREKPPHANDIAMVTLALAKGATIPTRT